MSFWSQTQRLDSLEKHESREWIQGGPIVSQHLVIPWWVVSEDCRHCAYTSVRNFSENAHVPNISVNTRPWYPSEGLSMSKRSLPFHSKLPMSRMLLICSLVHGMCLVAYLHQWQHRPTLYHVLQSTWWRCVLKQLIRSTSSYMGWSKLTDDVGSIIDRTEQVAFVTYLKTVVYAPSNDLPPMPKVLSTTKGTPLLFAT